MPAVTKVCKVCGKKYEACRTFTRDLGAFRFKDVVCSPECFSVWVERVEASRKQPSEILEEVLAETPVVEAKPVEDIIEIEIDEDNLDIDC